VNPADRSTTLSVSLLDGGVTVTIDDADLKRWLIEVTTPFLLLGPEQPGLPAFSISVSPAAPSLGGRSLGHRACFALDTEVTSLPARQGPSWLELEFAQQGVLYRLGTEVIEVGPLHPDANLRNYAYVALRELLTAQVLRPDRLQLHAAAVALEGRVALLMGGRGAGKTTTLLHLLSSGAVALVANDRVLASSTNAGWRIDGIPTMVRVRPGTLALLPGVLGSAPLGRSLHLHEGELATATEAQLALAPGLGPALSLRQMARFTDSPVAGPGLLGAMAFLSVDQQAAGFTLRRLGRSEALGALGAVRYGLSTEPRPATVFERRLGRTAPGPSDPEALEAVIAATPCFELTIGPAQLARRGAAGELAEALLCP
jgi:hypothetical protein